jgi:F0F1-type ATP synthase delta subunit
MESKIKDDITEQKKRLEAKIRVATDLERQQKLNMQKHLEDRYLNHKEFGINKQILNEMAGDVQEHSQEKVIERADPKSFLA